MVWPAWPILCYLARTYEEAAHGLYCGAFVDLQNGSGTLRRRNVSGYVESAPFGALSGVADHYSIGPKIAVVRLGAKIIMKALRNSSIETSASSPGHTKTGA